jgi:hypothetical protein
VPEVDKQSSGVQFSRPDINTPSYCRFPCLRPNCAERSRYTRNSLIPISTNERTQFVQSSLLYFPRTHSIYLQTVLELFQQGDLIFGEPETATVTASKDHAPTAVIPLKGVDYGEKVFKRSLWRVRRLISLLMHDGGFSGLVADFLRPQMCDLMEVDRMAHLLSQEVQGA